MLAGAVEVVLGLVGSCAGSCSSMPVQFVGVLPEPEPEQEPAAQAAEGEEEDEDEREEAAIRAELAAERAALRAETVERERQETILTAKRHRELWRYKLMCIPSSSLRDPTCRAAVLFHCIFSLTVLLPSQVRGPTWRHDAPLLAPLLPRRRLYRDY